jgi:anti-sigma28 factor (negative regulator of flagellin synthesis)
MQGVRIHNNPSPPPQVTDRTTHKTQQADSNATTNAAVPGHLPDNRLDRVHISSLAEVLRAPDTSASERAQRVRELAAEYAAGRYNPDPIAIAKGLVREATVGV